MTVDTILRLGRARAGLSAGQASPALAGAGPAINAPRYNHTVAERELGYHREGDTYTLTFSYATFSMNVFTYNSQTRRWYESGYY